MCPCLKDVLVIWLYKIFFKIFFSFAADPNPVFICLSVSMEMHLVQFGLVPLRGLWSWAVIHCRTQTYNFNVISRDSDPSFGVRDKPSGLGKSPGKAHLKEEQIAISFSGDESHYSLHLVNSIR